MRKIFVMVLWGFLLSGCTALVAKPADVTTESPRQELRGVVSVVGEKIFLIKDGKNIDIFSRKMDLKTYGGKTVTVVGEYSGTTLFVDEVKP